MLNRYRKCKGCYTYYNVYILWNRGTQDDIQWMYLRSDHRRSNYYKTRLLLRLILLGLFHLDPDLSRARRIKRSKLGPGCRYSYNAVHGIFILEFDLGTEILLAGCKCNKTCNQYIFERPHTHILTFANNDGMKGSILILSPVFLSK